MIRRPLAALALLGLFASPLAAQPPGDYPAMPKAGPPKPFAVPASETYRLPNGMQVTLIPYGQVPKATVSLRIYAGNIDEGDKDGLASFTGQMLREGAGGRGAADIAAAAASMGGGLGVNVGDHETRIFPLPRWNGCAPPICAASPWHARSRARRPMPPCSPLITAPSIPTAGPIRATRR
jgi:zinc protease